MELEIAIMQLVAAALTLVTAILAFLPALGKAIRCLKEKRHKR